MDEPYATKSAYRLWCVDVNAYSMSASAGFDIAWMPNVPSVVSLVECKECIVSEQTSILASSHHEGLLVESAMELQPWQMMTEV
jgi:hypothetical protein